MNSKEMLPLAQYNLTIQSALISLYFSEYSRYSSPFIYQYLENVHKNLRLKDKTENDLFKTMLKERGLNPLKYDLENGHYLLLEAERALLLFLKEDDYICKKVVRESITSAIVSSDPIILFKDRSISFIKMNRERIRYISKFFYENFDLLLKTIRYRKKLQQEYQENGGILLRDIIK